MRRAVLLSGLVMALTALSAHAEPRATHMQSPLPVAQAIKFAHSYHIPSRSLHEERTINVWLPRSYGQGSKTYPVLYVIDGGMEQDFVHIVGAAQLGMIWGRNAEAIVVGVETKDRRKELVGPTTDADLLKKYPTAGKSADFRRFIRDEVKPLIQQRYRTDGSDAVIGESLAGLFILEAWLREPGLFGGYAAISPSLWWDKQALSRQVAALPAARMAAQPRLYLNIANEGAEMQEGVDRVVAALRPVSNWCYAPRPDLTHATIYHQSEAAAIQFLFPSPDARDTEGFELVCANHSPASSGH